MYGLGFFINWKDMDFGTEQNPQCGICNRPERYAHYKNGILQEDIICDDCSKDWSFENKTFGEDGFENWSFDDCIMGYERNESHPISHMIHHYRGWKFQEGFGDIPFMEWYFYYDNDQLSERIVRRNWVRSKYRYWTIE